MDLQNTHGRDAVPLMMADEIFVPPPADDDELVFADATNLSNPLAEPLVASLRLIQKLKGEKEWFRRAQHATLDLLHEANKKIARLEQEKRALRGERR